MSEDNKACQVVAKCDGRLLTQAKYTYKPLREMCHATINQIIEQVEMAAISKYPHFPQILFRGNFKLQKKSSELELELDRWRRT